MHTQNYNVTGMTCNHCEMSVREEVSEIPGITDITVSAADGHLTITSSSPIEDTTVLAAVEEAGFTATRA